MSPAGAVEVRPEALESPVAQELIGELNAELSLQYPPSQRFTSLAANEVAEGSGRFVVAWMDGAAVGCGAVRMLDGSEVEVKRMFVVPGLRGRGISRAILSALEEEAGRLGARRVVLETGVRQEAALGLYPSAGYERIPPFGPYVASPASVCFAKDLAPLPG